MICVEAGIAPAVGRLAEEGTWLDGLDLRAQRSNPGGPEIRRRWPSEHAATIASLLTGMLLVQACGATRWEALAPPEGRPSAEAERDAEECRTEAKLGVGDVVSGAGRVGGMTVVLMLGLAIVGAGVGAWQGADAASNSGANEKELIGLIAGGAAGGAIVGAAFGLVAGLVMGAKNEGEKMSAAKRQVYDDCLRQRGYTAAPGDRD